MEQEAKVKTEETKMMRAEKNQVETQLDKMRSQQRDARAELDSLRDELNETQNTRDALERAKRALESDRIALKNKFESAEDQLSEMGVRLLNAENFERRLVTAERQILEKSETLFSLEAENRSLKQQVKFFFNYCCMELKKKIF